MKIGYNLGSGQRRFTSTTEVFWTNVDCVTRPDQIPDLMCDIRNMPLENETADYAVLHHVCEHFHCSEGDSVITEAWRVLKPGGSLIICVPNLKELAHARIANRISDYIYKVNLYGAWQGQPGDDHHWGWWEAWDLIEWLWTLKHWSKVQPFDWREIPGAALAHDWWICGVEAVK